MPFHQQHQQKRSACTIDITALNWLVYMHPWLSDFHTFIPNTLWIQLITFRNSNQGEFCWRVISSAWMGDLFCHIVCKCRYLSTLQIEPVLMIYILWSHLEIYYFQKQIHTESMTMPWCPIITSTSKSTRAYMFHIKTTILSRNAIPSPLLPLYC